MRKNKGKHSHDSTDRVVSTIVLKLFFLNILHIF